MSNSSNENGQEMVDLALAVQRACVDAALGAYENARMDGLCHEGAWEVAVGAMRSLNVQRIVEKIAVQDNQRG